ncbi:MAG TPA: leucyl aminopeptidase [Bryobacteraceae bacterium]|nr:leucyl aminopeptidase [Bryobacteraceae bacterium]
MEIKLITTAPELIEIDALVAFCFAGGSTLPPLNGAAADLLAEACASGEFDPKPCETLLIHRPGGLAARRLLVAGAGERDKLTAALARQIAGAAIRTLKPMKYRSAAFIVDGELASPAMVEAVAEGVLLADFETDRLKTDPKLREKHIDRVYLAVAQAAPAMETALAKGIVVAGAQNFTRTLVNEPSNLMTPPKLAEHARALAAEHGLKIDILDEPRLRQMGCGALLGVAQGSIEPPCLIHLEYVPDTAVDESVHLALVGKGVTFDTGGVSIKPSEGMEKMKYDMAGAASVLGAMAAIAQLKPAVRVSAFAPCVENMLSNNAQRPGDIVRTLSGKTVEVLNTDAEGRLILADALTYATRNCGATHVVDAATLTGAIVVALGHIHAGLFSNNAALQDLILAASKAAGETFWPMPLDDDYNDYLKSPSADLPNIGGRWGGAVTAAKFLESFVEGKPWAHLDIAGTAWLEEGKPYLAKGPSGLPVRTFVELALAFGAR